MTLRALLKGGVWVSAGGTLSMLASFLRNLFIARLVSVEDFGIASALAMTMLIVEMASNLAIDRLLVQAPDGDDPRFLSTAHAFQAIRGLIGAIVLFLLAGTIATLFKVPHATWAFQTVALVPLIKGLSHLDIIRYQRELRFAPASWVELIPQIITLLLAIPLARWLNDYSAMLWLIIIQIGLSVLISHALAERRYHWSLDTSIIRRMYAYGWPLLINAFLMFMIFQGDKLVVGLAYSPETLGWFSAAFAFALAPSMLATKVLQSILLPLLSRNSDDILSFQQRARLANDSCIFFGFLIAIFFILFGPEVFVFLFGKKYMASGTILLWMGIAQGIRVCKSGPVIIALALKETKNPMLSNMPRLLSVCLAALVALRGYDLVWVVVIAMFGEALAFLLSILLLRHRDGLLGSGLTNRLAILSVLIILSLLISATGSWPPGYIKYLALLVFGSLGFIASGSCYAKTRVLLKTFY